jgi:hypothetical protein
MDIIDVFYADMLYTSNCMRSKGGCAAQIVLYIVELSLVSSAGFGAKAGGCSVHA